MLGWLITQNYIEGVDNARNVTQDREQDIDPEVFAQPDFQKDTEGRKDNCDDDFDDFTHVRFYRKSRANVTFL